MRIFLKNLFLSIILLPLLTFARQGSSPDIPGGSQSSGQLPDGEGGAKLINPLGNKTLIEFFQDILDVIMVFAVPIIVLFIIYAGFQYVMARGNPTAIQNANRALLYAVIGGVLILGAEILLFVIGGTVDSLSV